MRKTASEESFGCKNLPGEVPGKLAAYIVMLSNAQIPEPTLDDLVNETRKTYSGPLEVGGDLTSFEIGDTVTVHRFKQ